MADENNISKLLAALIGPYQDLENSGQQLRTQCSISSAIGVQLDVLGRLVDQKRNGDDDETYRRRIRARIAVHRSNGLTEDLIKVADLVVYADGAQYQVDTQGVATVVVRVLGVAISEDLADIAVDFLLDAKAGGVRLILESSAHDLPAEWFRFDVGPGYDVGYFMDARDHVVG